jgi:hypothetical protein
LGYSGEIAVLQVIRSTAADSAASFQVRMIDTPGDTAGRLVLKLPLEWLHIRDDRPTTALPLFPTLPAYFITPDSDLVWTAGDTFSVRRQTADGVVKWKLESNVLGSAITSEEIAKIAEGVAKQHNPQIQSSFDSARAHTGKNHAAIAGLLVSKDGRVLVAAPQTALSVDVDLYRLSATGEPIDRFAMPRQSHVLLFSGDSLMVQRPGANGQPELRWLLLKK